MLSKGLKRCLISFHKRNYGLLWHFENGKLHTYVRHLYFPLLYSKRILDAKKCSLEVVNVSTTQTASYQDSVGSYIYQDIIRITLWRRFRRSNKVAGWQDHTVRISFRSKVGGIVHMILLERIWDPMLLVSYRISIGSKSFWKTSSPLLQTKCSP